MNINIQSSEIKMKSLKALFWSLILALVIASCSPTIVPPTIEPTKIELVIKATDTPEIIQTTPDNFGKTITVLAAASLTEPFSELGKMFEAANPGVKIIFSFTGSQQLAQQITEGAPADVFASASEKYMDAMVTAEKVKTENVLTFIKNKLVVIYPTDNPAGILTLVDLSKPGVKLDLAAAEVPVGKYSLDFLDKAANDPTFPPQFKENVIKNVVSYEDNVKTVLTKVLLGEVDAGIVYTSDISGKDAAQIGRLEIPEALNVIASYSIAPLFNSKNPDLAQAFVDLVISPYGQAVLSKYGFMPAVENSSTSGSFTVTDALGRDVTFDKIPQRIVLAGKAFFMVADAIYTFPEAGKNIAAIVSTSQGSGNFIPMIDPTFSEKIPLDGSAGPEEIAAVQPDCVIMKSSNAEKLGTPLEALKIPVVYLDFETPEQYQRDLKTLGQLFKNSDQAAKVAAYYQNKVDSITKVVSTLKDDQKPRTLILYYSDKDGVVAFNVPPMSWMQTILVQTAGGLPVWQDANPGNGWTKVSLEQVAAWDPDVIFIISYLKPVKEVVNLLKADPQWQLLDAIKNNKVYGFATDVYSWDQPDTRWILGLTWVTGKLHPDLFPGLDITKEAQSFYKDLYGMDDASFQKNIQPLLTGDIN